MFITVNTIILVVLCIPVSVLVSVALLSNTLNKTNNFGDFKATILTFSDSGLEKVDWKDNVKSDTGLDPVRNPVILRHNSLKKDKE